MQDIRVGPNARLVGRVAMAAGSSATVVFPDRERGYGWFVVTKEGEDTRLTSIDGKHDFHEPPDAKLVCPAHGYLLAEVYGHEDEDELLVVLGWCKRCKHEYTLGWFPGVNAERTVFVAPSIERDRLAAMVSRGLDAP